jgi:hypothetical protein
MSYGIGFSMFLIAVNLKIKYIVMYIQSMPKPNCTDYKQDCEPRAPCNPKPPITIDNVHKFFDNSAKCSTRIVYLDITNAVKFRYDAFIKMVYNACSHQEGIVGQPLHHRV